MGRWQAHQGEACHYLKRLDVQPKRRIFVHFKYEELKQQLAERYTVCDTMGSCFWISWDIGDPSAVCRVSPWTQRFANISISPSTLGMQVRVTTGSGELGTREQRSPWRDSHYIRQAAASLVQLQTKYLSIKLTLQWHKQLGQFLCSLIYPDRLRMSLLHISLEVCRSLTHAAPMMPHRAQSMSFPGCKRKNTLSQPCRLLQQWDALSSY